VNQLRTEELTFLQVMFLLRTQPWCKSADRQLSTTLSGLSSPTINESVLARYGQELSMGLWRDWIRPKVTVKATDLLVNATVDPKERVLTLNMPVPEADGKIDLTAVHRVKVGYKANRFWYEEFNPSDRSWNHFARMAANMLYGGRLPGAHKFYADSYEPMSLAALNAVCACHYAGIAAEVIIDMAQDGVI
jgi:hypothetical protein